MHHCRAVTHHPMYRLTAALGTWRHTRTARHTAWSPPLRHPPGATPHSAHRWTQTPQSIIPPLVMAQCRLRGWWLQGWPRRPPRRRSQGSACARFKRTRPERCPFCMTSARPGPPYWNSASGNAVEPCLGLSAIHTRCHISTHTPIRLCPRPPCMPRARFVVLPACLAQLVPTPPCLASTVPATTC